MENMIYERVYKKPNLFAFATSELSQDAVLIWLLNWAKPECASLDNQLHQVGKRFLEALLLKQGLSFNSFEKIEVKAQYKKIDILIEIVAEDKKIAVIIEDKVKSSERDNQLAKYVNEIKKKELDYLVPIYLKTGFQHDLTEIAFQQYHHFSTYELVEIFKYGLELGIKNEIFLDYSEFLTEIESECKLDETSFSDFSLRLVAEWNWWNWRGFFHKYKNPLNAKTDIVPNGREKLVAFWFGGCDKELQYEGCNYTFHPYVDVKYSEKKYFSITYRLSLKEKSQMTIELRNILIVKFRDMLTNEGIEVRVPKFKTANHSIELLKIKSDPGLNELSLLALIKKLEKVIGEI